MTDSVDLQTERMREALNVLRVIEDQDVPRLPERIFKEVFLPLFCGDAENPYKATFSTWYQFSGSPYTPVDVIDTAGRVLFRVPPILDKTAINSNPDVRLSIFDVIATSEQLSKIHPNQGRVYLDVELTKRAKYISVPTDMLETLATWNSIFKRYDRPEIQTMAQPEENTTAGKSGFSEDDFELL